VVTGPQNERPGAPRPQLRKHTEMTPADLLRISHRWVDTSLPEAGHQCAALAAGSFVQGRTQFLRLGGLPRLHLIHKETGKLLGEN